VREEVILLAPFNLLPSNRTLAICLGSGDMSKLGKQTKYLRLDPEAKRFPCSRIQAGAECMGLVGKVSFVCKTCPCNAQRALEYRHGGPQPVVSRNFDLFISYIGSVHDPVQDLFISSRAYWQEHWLPKWPAVKQMLIRQSISKDPVMHDRVFAMVKRECDHKMPSRPRLIQYNVNLATQAHYAAEMYAMQKAWTTWFQRRNVGNGIRITFASGLNANTLGDWMRNVLEDVDAPHFYERDGKSWDATMQAPHLGVRLAAYKLAGADFCESVAKGFKVVGRDPHGPFKYQVDGTVKSGHNDTTLGNSIVNACIAYTAMRAMGLRGDIIVAGDDLLIVVAGDFDADALARVEGECGITPEYRKFDDPRDVSFISGIWLPIEDDWLFIPRPGRLLARLFWTTRPPPPKKRQLYLNSIVLGLRPTCGQIPVIGAFLDAHYGDVSGAAIPHEKRLKVWGVGKTAPRAALLRVMASRYGLTEEEMVEAEEFLTSLAGRVGVFSHPVLDRIMEVDLADLAGRPLSH